MKYLLASGLIFFSLAFGFFAFKTNQDMAKIYDFKVETIDGKELSLSEYKGKTLLIVNVASKCGLTPQYEELQALYEEFKNQGLIILGFPANDFMGQEPGTNEEIKTFCRMNYGVGFPMFAKISVQGDNIHPLYSYLTQKSENGVLDVKVRWNFQKFLISPQGKLLESFAPRQTVTEKEVREAIIAALPE